jgi:N-acylneuraminate cytidylyltransferase
MWREGTDGSLQPLLSSELSEPYNMPRQKLPQVVWQTGHIDVIRTATILEQHSLTGRRVRPVAIEPRYCIDIDSAGDLDAAARLMAAESLDIDRPGPQGDPGRIDALPDQIDLVVFDFDGVFTDGTVIVFQDGTEAVTCDRSDGMGIAMLRERGVPMVVLSTEENLVVAARCRKLQLDCVQGVADKGLALRRLAGDRGASLANTVFVGNDVNDVACLQAVGCGVVPADAHPDARARAHVVLACAGGQGAVRELCDSILRSLSGNKRHATHT